MTLKNKIVSGSLWSFIGNVSFQLSGLVIFIILSRILSPVDFGTAALAIVFVELTNTIVRYGLVEVVVRNKNNSNVENSIFFATLLIGIASSLFFIIASPYLEVLFDAPGLALSLQILSIIPIMQALTTVPEGLLKRDFKFKALAIRLLFSSLFSGAVAIYLAYASYGFYSLIIQKIISIFLSLLLVWKAIKWRPKFKISSNDILSILKQGQPILLSSLVGQGIFRFVELIIGFFLGVVVLGYFKIAGKLLDVIVQFTIRPIVDVSFSAFSTLQSDSSELEACFIKFVTTTALFSLPIFIGGFIIGDEMVYLVFGDKWSESGVIFSILCLSGFSASFNYFFAPLCHATHNSNIPFKLRVVEFIITISVVSFFAQYSIFHVVFSNVVIASILTTSMLFILGSKFSFSIKSMIISLLPTIVSSFVMGGVLYLVDYFILFEEQALVKVVLIIPMGLLFYFVFYRLLFPEVVLEIIDNIKNLKNKK
ncbi:lipopolysaccharide biosynthesis protein [Pseudoalteromonas sp. BSi20429]|uniref:lipopolysaccharide biosynthesis protein n=1 Tax=Pseudoalteromonas sp. BSi20429 TaxID=1097676 RepID=UPI000231B722|nr:lipopolysaccharide biosynthesis protein [Pseudoalteromonas sp. BSi20429]GAA69114.1 polysaccharide transporter, PST family [Pseudoalteromonas sp. BSi20429]